MLAIIVVLFFVGFIFILVKIGQLKNRGMQHLLKNTCLSSSNIMTQTTNTAEKKHLQRFLAEHSEYTEEYIKEILKLYTVHMINQDYIDDFTPSVCQKIENDRNLVKLKDMEFKRANINFYKDQKLNAVVVYTNQRDEYNIYLYCMVVNDNIKLEKYQITKGSIIGF